MTTPPFDFITPTQVLFGEGRSQEAAALVAGLGRRAVVVRGGGELAAPLVRQLRSQGVDVAEVEVRGEPRLTMVEAGARTAREERRDVVVAVGGGSVIDAGKAIAALATNPEPARHYLEVVGAGRPLTATPLPIIAIPTTAGTGAEVTRNAVLLAEPEGVKVSLRSPRMVPVAAILDPWLTRSLPRALTVSTGLDALTQCIEPFVSPFATPLTDALAREGMRRAARALPRAADDGADLAARADLMLAALCSGMALANARLGAVHGFAAPLGGRFPVSHGMACARLLAPVTGANVRALLARDPDSPALSRYAEVARLVSGTSAARLESLAPWLASLVDALGVPRLSAFGVRVDNVPELCTAARAASSMKGNPVILTDEELQEALTEAL